MTTKTDYHALRELRVLYTPTTYGIVTKEEAQAIRCTLELDARNNIELQNIRDMSVLLYGERADRYRADGDIDAALAETDAVSAVCAIVDQEKVKRGLEV